MLKTLFQDNHVHSDYSDGHNTLVEIFEYNNLHDKLDLVLSDHVDKDTRWFSEYVEDIKKLRQQYSDFFVKIGCEVKIIDESGKLNTTEDIINLSEIVIGSVHNFSGIKVMGPQELLVKEYELTKLLAQNHKIDILAHPFSMCYRFYQLEPPMEYVEEIYKLCVENNIKFEYSYKYACSNIRNFIKQEIAKGNINNFSFGSDAHHIEEIGNSVYKLLDPIIILVTGTGAGVGQSIIKAIKLSKINTKIIAADNSYLAAGMYRADKAYLVPLAKEEGFVEKIIEICRKEKVDLILVGTDVELLTFAINKEKIESSTTAKLIISDPETISIADDKWKTTQFLKDNGFPFPKSALMENLDEFIKEVGFPFIIKPKIGARSIGFNIINNENELRNKITKIESPIMQEYLSTEDDEYTCSSLFIGGRCYGVLSMKRWLRNGDTYKAIIKNDLELESFVEEVGKKLNINGPCNFQLRKTKDGPKIFEINCRFSGTTGACSFVGFNVINALLHKIFFNKDPKRLSFKETYMFRYWNEMFVDEKYIKSLENKKFINDSYSDLNIF